VKQQPESDSRINYPIGNYNHTVINDTDVIIPGSSVDEG
jgi:hypothetical protein